MKHTYKDTHGRLRRAIDRTPINASFAPGASESQQAYADAAWGALSPGLSAEDEKTAGQVLAIAQSIDTRLPSTTSSTRSSSHSRPSSPLHKAKMNPGVVTVESIGSAAISAFAAERGIVTAELLSSGGEGDNAITVYRIAGVLVADTNADPVWEESADPDEFAELLKSCGINRRRL